MSSGKQQGARALAGLCFNGLFPQPVYEMMLYREFLSIAAALSCFCDRISRVSLNPGGRRLYQTI